MYPPNHYHTMTDAQLEQYDRLTRLVDRLTHDLDESRRATEAVQAAAEVERSKLRAELLQHAEEIITLTAKHADQQSANRRLCGQQVQLSKALRALVDAVKRYGQYPHMKGNDEKVMVAMREGREVLALVEVPFG